MADLIKYLDSLSPFLQGVLGSAVFALAMLLVRLSIRRVQSRGRTFSKLMASDLVFRHMLYKKYVYSERINLAMRGQFFVICQALHWLINAGSILVFVFAISSLIERQWLLLLGYFFALNALIEANSWLKDWSDEKHIANLDAEFKAELLKKFFPNEHPPGNSIEG